MDYSISYHPISEAQMRTWYYNVFEDIGTVNDLTLRIPKWQPNTMPSIKDTGE